MVKFCIIILGVMQLVLWLGFLVPQYYALKNRRYKTVAICCTALCVSMISCAIMVWYGDFIAIAQTGEVTPDAANADDWVLTMFGALWLYSMIFCWWYIYKRKSFDFVHIEGYTADEVEKTVSPECKKLLGYQDK